MSAEMASRVTPGVEFIRKSCASVPFSDVERFRMLSAASFMSEEATAWLTITMAGANL